MLRIALTGGIATGKSYVRGRLAARGIPTIDADRLARDAAAPGAPAFDEIVRRFGSDVVQPDGQIDRRRLAALVFADPAARRALEAIVHPRVYDGIERWFVGLAAEGGVGFGVADVPLLFETGHAASFDRVIVAACPPEEQVRRVMQRDGLTESEARQRLEAQLPIGEKAARADFVVQTGGTTADTDRQVDDLLARLEAAAAQT